MEEPNKNIGFHMDFPYLFVYPTIINGGGAIPIFSHVIFPKLSPQENTFSALVNPANSRNALKIYISVWP